MAHVIIKAIRKRGILSKSDFEYLQSNVGNKLKLLSVSYERHNGNIWSFAVYRDDTAITVFPDKATNDVDFEVNYNDSN